MNIIMPVVDYQDSMDFVDLRIKTLNGFHFSLFACLAASESYLVSIGQRI